MWPERVSDLGPLALVLPIALRGPAYDEERKYE